LQEICQRHSLVSYDKGLQRLVFAAEEMQSGVGAGVVAFHLYRLAVSSLISDLFIILNKNVQKQSKKCSVVAIFNVFRLQRY